MQNSAESQFFKELIEKYLPPAPAKPDPDKVKTFIILSKLRSNIPPPRMFNVNFCTQSSCDFTQSNRLFFLICRKNKSRKI